MSRFIFPIIAGIGLILMKVLPDFVSPKPIDDLVSPKPVDELASQRGRVDDLASQGGRVDDLFRTIGDAPIRKLEASTIAAIKASPAFRSARTSENISEGPRYSVARISTEISKVGTRNIREYTEYVEATHSVLTTVPRDSQEFKGIFNRVPNAAENNELVSEAKAGTGGFHHVGDEDSLLHSVEHQNSNFVTIVGHNEDGFLKLPNGKTIKMELIAQHCADLGKKCIFLSCNSDKYLSAKGSAFGVDRQITFKGAHLIANALTKRMLEKRNIKRSMSYLRTSDLLSRELKVLTKAANLSETIAAGIKPVIMTGSIGGIYLAVNVNEEKP